jgi:hypothetical protein
MEVRTMLATLRNPLFWLVLIGCLLAGGTSRAQFGWYQGPRWYTYYRAPFYYGYTPNPYYTYGYYYSPYTYYYPYYYSAPNYVAPYAPWTTNYFYYW